MNQKVCLAVFSCKWGTVWLIYEFLVNSISYNQYIWYYVNHFNSIFNLFKAKILASISCNAFFFVWRVNASQ